MSGLTKEKVKAITKAIAERFPTFGEGPYVFRPGADVSSVVIFVLDWKESEKAE